MSHFIICSIPTITFGTPNGHARTQLEQAMHRGFSDDCTTPSGVFLIASAGHTCAHVGSSQCMQTMGTVAVVRGLSMKSTWISECPRWVSHSAHAFTHDSQPMHREGSMKKP
jgi:hypothetical protein